MGLNIQSSGSAIKPIADMVCLEHGCAVFDAAAPALTTVAPTKAYDNAALVNCSTCFVRGTVTYADPATAGGDGTFIMAPGGSHAFGFEEEDQILSIDLELVDPPTAAGACTAADYTPKAVIPSGANALVLVNFLEQ